jgi:linoleoyl-CoA desaturase
MRGQHIQIYEDSELLISIRAKISKELVINATKDKLFILFKFIFYLSLTVACYMSLFFTETRILFWGCFMLYGFLSLLFAFNFAHDFSHNTIFRSKKWNNIGFTLIYTLVGAHADAWKQRHINSHHFAPNVEGYDTDLNLSKLIRVIPHSKYYSFQRFQHIYAPLAYTIYSLFWIFIKDFVVFFSKDEYTPHKNFRYHLVFWTQKCFYLVYILVLPIVYTTHQWYVVLSGFLFMHLSLSLFLLFTFFMTHHVENTIYPATDEHENIETSWMMNQIKSSNDMHPFSKIANFIFGGFNNHIAHHLFPNIHHIYYPRLNIFLYKILNENRIQPNQTTYWGGIISHLRLLKRMSYE